MNQLNRFNDYYSKAEFSKEFILGRIKDIERTIIDTRLKKEDVLKVTLENLELNKYILHLIENAQPVKFH